ncbi:hypothetical protein [Paenibacillus eucommiae]|uniref:Uncharacterized protein n=1 Tax=Paenibacillus eucommiae TaxID=1355755 RepID=A0ABS4ILW5_9BACL|nr:hypothetical protein [Paenibacillus eucommiae]MBP1988554.1 hypothetical protein [Paenibacillus eucommiae]
MNNLVEWNLPDHLTMRLEEMRHLHAAGQLQESRLLCVPDVPLLQL